MKYFLLSFLIATQSFATCNWATDVKELGGAYVYDKDCHLEVGKLHNQNKELKQAIEERKKEEAALKESLQMKDLAISKADERIQGFREEAYSQYDRLKKQEKMARVNDYLYFGTGVVVTILSVWAAGQLRTK